MQCNLWTAINSTSIGLEVLVMRLVYHDATDSRILSYYASRHRYVATRKALMNAAELFLTPASYLRVGRATPRQKYIIGLVLCRNGKIHSDISLTPPLIFTGVKKCETWPRFFFEAIWFKNGVTYQKSTTKTGA